MRLLTAFATVLTFIRPLAAQESNRLPAKRIVLYKNGVGYFEHVGTVSGNQQVTVPFSSSQLNDVLKSLTVLDLNGGRIAAVAYGTDAPVARELTGLQLPAPENSSLGSFLQGMRGTRIVVKTAAGAVTGRVLGTATRSRTAGTATSQTDYVSLLADNGEIRTIELSPAVSLQLLEPGLPSKLARYLDGMSPGRSAPDRQMVISAEGTGERELFISYISETPVWKSTYRIVLKPGTSASGKTATDKPAASEATLQAWAIVDNTSSEDWDHVQLSLVAGAPQSFVQDLSQPFYTRRPTVELMHAAMTTPQTQEATLAAAARLTGVVRDPVGTVIPQAELKAYDSAGTLLGQAVTDGRGAYTLANLPDSPFRLIAQAPGFQTSVENNLRVAPESELPHDVRLDIGSVASSVAIADGAAPADGNGAMLGTGKRLGSGAGRGQGHGAGSGSGTGGGVFRMSAPTPQAVAQDLGDLFEYRLKDPVTIAKGRSALLPISQAKLSVERVSLWNEQAGVAKPQRALWLTNSSDLTLDAGSLSVIDSDAFAGETIIESIRPGEKRLVTYATDLALTVNAKADAESQRVTRARIAQGMMTQQSEVRESKTYTVRNEDAEERIVVIEHPFRAAYQLRGELKPVETSPRWRRFSLRVPPHQTASLTVEEARPTESVVTLASLTPEQVGVFVRQKSIDTSIQAALGPVMQGKAIVAEFEQQRDACEEQASQIFDDQQRLRENIKALKGTAEEKALLQRYTRQLDEQETRLADLDRQKTKLENKRRDAEQKLNDMVAALTFDVQL